MLEAFTGDAVWMIPAGFAIGLVGSMVGVGGGFVIVPMLILLRPEMLPAVVTGISLAVIALNAWSSVAVYAAKGRIDFRVGLTYAAIGIPGVYLGTWTVSRLDRESFGWIMGLSLTAMAIFLFQKSFARDARAKEEAKSSQPEPRTVTSVTAIGSGISLVVGFISALLGIGGGVIHVPAMVYWMQYTAARAVATSQLLLAVMASVSTGINFAHGTLNGHWDSVLWLGLGAVVGAQIGSRLADRVNGVYIIRVLAGILLVSALRVMFG